MSHLVLWMLVHLCNGLQTQQNMLILVWSRIPQSQATTRVMSHKYVVFLTDVRSVIFLMMQLHSYCTCQLLWHWCRARKRGPRGGGRGERRRRRRRRRRRSWTGGLQLSPYSCSGWPMGPCSSSYELLQEGRERCNGRHLKGLATSLPHCGVFHYSPQLQSFM